jgi:hypothetical protein
MNTISGTQPMGHTAHVQIQSRSICEQKASDNVCGLITSGFNISSSDFMNWDYFLNEILGADERYFTESFLQQLSVSFHEERANRGKKNSHSTWSYYGNSI